MAERIDITLADPRELESLTFANIVDPINLEVLISRIKDTKEKRSLAELIEEFLMGR